MEKLYRSKSDRLVAGVCGGLAEHFHVSVTPLRILTVIFSATLIPLYLVLWLIVPEEGEEYF